MLHLYIDTKMYLHPQKYGTSTYKSADAHADVCADADTN